MKAFFSDLKSLFITPDMLDEPVVKKEESKLDYGSEISRFYDRLPEIFCS